MVSCAAPASATTWRLLPDRPAPRRGKSSSKAQDLAARGASCAANAGRGGAQPLDSRCAARAFLSSGPGFDGSCRAGVSRERSGTASFPVVFPELEFSEAPAARQIAARFGTEHQELMVTAEEMQSRLGEAIEALDQPSMDGVNTFFVSWAARQVGLKVALSGLGGDEVFGGYPTFRLTPRVARWASGGRVRGPFCGAMKAMAASGLETSQRWRAAARGPDAAAEGGGQYLAQSSEARRILTVLYAHALHARSDRALAFGCWSRREVGVERSECGSLARLEWSAGAGGTAQAPQLEGDSAVVIPGAIPHVYMVDTLLRDT